MSVKRVVERSIGKSTTYTQTGRQRARVFLVEFTTPELGTDWANKCVAAVDPNTATAIPAVGDAHPDDSRAIVRSLAPVALGDKGDAYEVKIEYDTKSDFAGFNGSDVTFIENPIDRSPSVSWTFEQVPEVLYFAHARIEGFRDDDWTAKTWVEAGFKFVDGNPVSISIPIQNTRNQPFDPPITIETNRIVGVMTRNEIAWDGAQALEYQDAVNSDLWFGFNPGQVRMSNISADRIWESGIWYYRVRYEVKIQKHWYKFLPNVAILSDGTEVYIDASGTELPAGSQPYFIGYRVFNELPFAPLDLI